MCKHLFHIFPYLILVLLVRHLILHFLPFFFLNVVPALFVPCFLFVISFNTVSFNFAAALSSFVSQAPCW